MSHSQNNDRPWIPPAPALSAMSEKLGANPPSGKEPLFVYDIGNVLLVYEEVMEENERFRKLLRRAYGMLDVGPCSLIDAFKMEIEKALGEKCG